MLHRNDSLITLFQARGGEGIKSKFNEVYLFVRGGTQETRQPTKELSSSVGRWADEEGLAKARADAPRVFREFLGL